MKKFFLKFISIMCSLVLVIILTACGAKKVILQVIRKMYVSPKKYY